MEKNIEEVNIITFYNDNFKRHATVSKDNYHYIVRCYNNEKLVKTELVDNHSQHYAEDLAENYVQKWGAFKHGN